MAITNQQFETWARQGAITTSKATGESIKRAINSYGGFPDGVTYDVYLQGSYKNNTNIYSESDVDVVVQKTGAFYNNLKQDQEDALGLVTNNYGFSDFRSDVLRALGAYYNLGDINPDNKVVKLAPSSNRRPADILICSSYREYYRVEHDTFHEGVYFRTTQTNETCYSFPERHYENAVRKNQDCNRNFKSMVRIFKNIKRTLVDRGDLEAKTAPSYYIECLLGNVPSENFEGSYSENFANILVYLANDSLDDFMCLNGLRSMWGDGNEKWSKRKALEFLQNTLNLWGE